MGCDDEPGVCCYDDYIERRNKVKLNNIWNAESDGMHRYVLL